MTTLQKGQTMLTTTALPTFLALREGFRAKAYDDKQPWLDLNPGDEDEVKGTLTYGHGLTKRADGSPVQIGDTITEQESFDRMNAYIREVIEPALENLIHVPLAGFQYDALGSVLYQYGEPEVAGWRLIRRINAGEDWEKLVLEWINGTVWWKGKPLFWARRVAEVLMFLGMDWRPAANIPEGSDLLEAVKDLGFDGNLPRPGPAPVDVDLFEELEIPRRGADPVEDLVDPTPDTPLTMADIQYQSAQAAGYDGSYADWIGHRVIVSKRNAIQAPNVDLASPPKAMEDSETARNYAKEISGRDDVRLATIMTGASATAGVASGLSKDVSVMMENTRTIIGGATLMQLVTVGLCLGVPFLIYGLWKMYRGRDGKEHGRAIATQPKV